MVKDNTTQRTTTLLSHGMPKDYANGERIEIIDASGNGPYAAAYLIYAHKCGVTLRDLACALLNEAECHLKLEKEDDTDDEDFIAEAEENYSDLTRFIRETDGGLELNEAYSAIPDFIGEWGCNDDGCLTNEEYKDRALALLAYHKSGETIMSILDLICDSDDDANSQNVIHEIKDFENDPRGAAVFRKVA